MASSTHGQHLLGKAIALVALTALLAYGCERSKERQATIRPTDSTPAPAAATPKPADPPASKPTDKPADKPQAKADDKPDGDTKPKLPPIPHDERAKDAKPLREWTTPTGVVVQEFKEGSGYPTLPKAVVEMHLVVYVKDGWKKIQSTWDDGAPDTQPLQEVVHGLADGLMGMKPGGSRRMIVPPERGFDKEEIKDPSGNVIIPAGSTLIFDVDLISAKQSILEKPPASAPKTDPAPNK